MYRYLFVSFLAIVVLGTAAIQPKEKPKRHIYVVAHRGANKFAPENTIAAYLKAAELGADFVEMDLRQTKDGEFVIMHDKNVNRTTNGKGNVADMTLEEIQQLDAGSWFGDEFKGEKVPTLREVLRAIKGKVKPDLDFKDGDPQALIDLLKEEGYLGEVEMTLYSGNHDLIAEIQKLTDAIKVRPGPKGDYNYMAQQLDPPIVNIDYNNYDKDYIDQIHEDGRMAYVNCLRSYDKKKFMQRAINLGADFIQSDNLDILIPQVQEHNKKVDGE